MSKNPTDYHFNLTDLPFSHTNTFTVYTMIIEPTKDIVIAKLLYQPLTLQLYLN